MWTDKTPAGNSIAIYQPKIFTFSNFVLLGWSVSALITKRAVVKTFEKIKPKPDILYAHFWSSGVVAGEIANKYNLHFVVATGESKIWVQDLYHDNYIQKRLKRLAGVISVSTKNLDESKKLGLGKGVPSIVLPNAIDESKFRVLDKQTLRKKYNFPQDVFIVSFLGAFIERKGPLRLLEAVERIADPAIKILFIGAGDQEPNGDAVLFKGRLPHVLVPEYLSCSDVFVLPTLAEGCSNAIVEAMACGLPIISSNLSFNKDILDDSNAIFVDPMNVKEIAEAIQFLKNDAGVCKTKGTCSYVKSRDLSITSRAKNILRFLNEICCIV
ncbi:MAG: glycosyltransferase family 4 protein [Clostridia bacterium]